MAEAIPLGTWLRRERERRGVTLTDISDQTKVSVPLLQGLEAGDLSRWPGGIFRRAYARSYATAIGVDPDVVVRRLEEEHPSGDDLSVPVAMIRPKEGTTPRTSALPFVIGHHTLESTRGIAVVLDLLVAGAIGFGFAAAGSRLLWPVLAIAAYHALGVLFAGRSPMMALLLDQSQGAVVPAVSSPEPAELRRAGQVIEEARPETSSKEPVHLRKSTRRRQLGPSRARA